MKTKCKVFVLLSIVYLWFIIPVGLSQPNVRTEINIPDIPGYVTLKCDFHIHTVFSDGDVWPPVRVDEAWCEGLDAIAITDHIEVQPHKQDIPTNFNRSYELALPRANQLDVILIRGAEITRSMPPGHFNAIFITDANPLNTEKWQDAIKAAIDQKAFVFWNHPGWRQPDNIPIWHDEHTEIYNNGWMYGMEIVNGWDYYPLAHQWCLEKKITMLGDSDIHKPIAMSADPSKGNHRPMTLVFAKEKSALAIYDALKARRTAVYSGNLLIGEEIYVKPIVDNSLTFKNVEMTIVGKDRAFVFIQNNSAIDYELTAVSELAEISIPKNITLYGNKIVRLELRGKSEEFAGNKELQLPYRVQNVLTAPGQGLLKMIPVKINFLKRQ